MMIWLDDIRKPPSNDWTWIKTAEQVVKLLANKEEEITFMSLDHDLGLECMDGYDLVKWMAEKNIWPAEGCVVHSQNPVGKENMVSTINRYFEPTVKE